MNDWINHKSCFMWHLFSSYWYLRLLNSVILKMFHSMCNLFLNLRSYSLRVLDTHLHVTQCWYFRFVFMSIEGQCFLNIYRWKFVMCLFSGTIAYCDVKHWLPRSVLVWMLVSWHPLFNITLKNLMRDLVFFITLTFLLIFILYETIDTMSMYFPFLLKYMIYIISVVFPKVWPFQMMLGKFQIIIFISAWL